MRDFIIALVRVLCLLASMAMVVAFAYISIGSLHTGDWKLGLLSLVALFGTLDFIGTVATWRTKQ